MNPYIFDQLFFNKCFKTMRLWDSGEKNNLSPNGVKTMNSHMPTNEVRPYLPPYKN